MIAYDLEADGLEVRRGMRVWCICTWDLATDERRTFGPDQIAAGAEYLRGRPRIAHNAYGYDEHVLRVVDPHYTFRGAHDSAVWCRLVRPDLRDHSLGAWGARVGTDKRVDLRPEDFGRWDPQLLAYCEADVETLVAVLRGLRREPGAIAGRLAFALEERFAQVIERRNRVGVALDVPRMREYLGELEVELAGTLHRLTAAIPGWEEELNTPEFFIGPYGHRYSRRGEAPKAERGLLREGPKRKKRVEFNPNSDAHLVRFLRESRGWEPLDFTDKGSPSMKAKVLRALPYEEARWFADYRECKKARDYISSAKGAGYLDRVDPDGRLRSRVVHLGTITSRCTHASPNVGNIWKRGERGARLREAFTTRAGWRMLGWDIARLELVGLGALLLPFDDGRFADLVQNEGSTYSDRDLHWINAEVSGMRAAWEPHLRALGMPEDEIWKEIRNKTKTLTYAWLYGSGDPNLGALLPAPPPDDRVRLIVENRQEYLRHQRSYEKRFEREAPDYIGVYGILGGRLRKRLERGIPGLKALIDECGELAKADRLVGVDGRYIPVRKQHAALNAKNQTWGAVVVKAVTVFFVDEAQRRGALLGRDWELVLHTHDEAQNEARPEALPALRAGFEAALPRARKLLRLPVSIHGEVVEGATWKDTH